MKVNAEIRDNKRLSSERVRIIRDFTIYILILPVIFLFEKFWLNVYPYFIILYLIAFIPFCIWQCKKANDSYKITWLTKEFDFKAKDNHLYLGDKCLHVNYNELYKKVYVHNLGEYKDPYKATFYATIKEPEVDMFVKFLYDNGVIIEKEEYPILPGRYGSLAVLRLNRYRK